jgi:hypothetical protein
MGADFRVFIPIVFGYTDKLGKRPSGLFLIKKGGITPLIE